VVKADDLVVGNTYFMVTYPDPGMSAPIVITYRYLGRDPEGVEEDEPGPHYYFRYLPAFQYEADEEALRSTSAWSEVFPQGFSGWGESSPTSFSQEKLAGFESLDGLIAELMKVRTRSEPEPRG
jgi:hypothetical protein